MNKIKPKFTEKEIEELNDIYQDWGVDYTVNEIIKFLKEKFGYSDVHSVITEIRKEFQNKRKNERIKIRDGKYPNSTLISKLSKRIDYEQNKL